MEIRQNKKLQPDPIISFTGSRSGKTVGFIFTMRIGDNFATDGMNRNFAKNFRKSGRKNIDDHLMKNSIVPMSFRHFTPSSQSIVNDYIRTLPADTKRRIIIIHGTD